MTDVGKVGPGKGTEPSGPKRKKRADAEAFREMMKVKKVRETDPEEKRKRKSQTEAEEDLKAQQLVSGTPQQGLGEEKAPSIYEPSPGVQSTGGSSAPGAPSPSEGEPPTPIEPTFEMPYEEPPLLFQPPPETEQREEVSQVAPSKRRKAEPTQEPSTPKKAPKGPKKALTPSKAFLEKEEAPKKPAEPPLPLGIEEAQGEIGSLFPPAKPKIEPKKEEEKEGIEGITIPAIPEGAWEATQHPKKKEKEIEKVEEKITPPSPHEIETPIPPEALTTTTSPFANLHPQVMDLFERMVGVMIVMNESGIKQTTINLNNPKFANSVFFGSQIIISEFSTAPKAFNIELLGNQQAVNLFANNTEELVAAFQAGNYTFKVNRIDTGYLPSITEEGKREVKRVKRKKSAGE